MKKLLLTTALVAGFGVSAHAQDAGTELFRAAPDAMEIRASDFIGMRVYATETDVSADAYEGAQTDWNDIGEINDVLLTREGDVAAVLVDIGGFLGMGERQVAVNMSALRMVSDSATADNEGDFFLVMNANQAALEGAPAYGMDGETMGSTDTAATGGTSDTTTTAQGGISDTATDATGGTSDTMAADTAAAGAATGAATVGGTASSAADGTMAADGTTTDGAGTMATDGTVTTGTDGTADTATDSGMAATDGTMAADGTAATDGTMATDGAATTAARTPIVRDGFTAAEGDYLTAEKLTGARVYDSTDTWIGDVSELVIDESGKINSAIVDVGGFLGMGAKPVALTMQDLDIIRNESGDEVRVYLSYTKDQLNQMETFAN